MRTRAAVRMKRKFLYENVYTKQKQNMTLKFHCKNHWWKNKKPALRSLNGQPTVDARVCVNRIEDIWFGTTSLGFHIWIYIYIFTSQVGYSQERINEYPSTLPEYYVRHQTWAQCSMDVLDGVEGTYTYMYIWPERRLFEYSVFLVLRPLLSIKVVRRIYSTSVYVHMFDKRTICGQV